MRTLWNPIRFICMCGAECAYGDDAETGKEAVIHPEPPCSHFLIAADPRDYLQAVREFLKRTADA